MAQILVRNLDSSIVNKLKSRAKKNGRSLEAELRLIIQNAITIDGTAVLKQVEQVRKIFAGRRFSDSAELIRKDRSR